jgi:hypothetical protein
MGCRAALLPAYADQRLVTRTDNRACGLLVKHLRIHNRVLTPSVAADGPTTADHYLHFPGNVNRPELRYFRLATVGPPSSLGATQTLRPSWRFLCQPEPWDAVRLDMTYGSGRNAQAE